MDGVSTMENVFINNILYVDDREDPKIFNKLEKKQINYVKQRLDVADYIYQGWMFERKEISDFYGSIISGRVFEQIINMKNNTENCALLISGSIQSLYTNRHIKFNINVIYGAIGTIISKFKIPVLLCTSDNELINIMMKIGDKSTQTSSFSGNKVTVKNKDIAAVMVSCIPGISYKKAISILKTYNIYELFNVSVEDLVKLDGIGKKRAENIKKYLNSNN